MGLDRVHAEMLLFEAKFKPITGKILTIGRQTIGLTLLQAKELIAEYGLNLIDDTSGEYVDTKTMGWDKDKQ